MGGKTRNRREVEPIYPIDSKYESEAARMMEDKEYQKKVNCLLSIMQGKRIAGKQGLGSIVNQGD